MFYLYLKANRKVITREYWVHPLYSQRDTEGAWSTVIEQVRELYPDKHKAIMRISQESFDILLHMVKDDITKMDTVMRRAITAAQRLCVTLLFLAAGDSTRTLSLLFRMGESSIRDIVYSTCAALWKNLKGKYVKLPNTVQEWLEVADG